jgi:hypothetical protein
MSIDFEERLRSEMAAVEVRPRPGLVREAYRGCQRRRARRDGGQRRRGGPGRLQSQRVSTVSG